MSKIEVQPEMTEAERRALATIGALEVTLAHFIIKVSQRLDTNSVLINETMIAAERDLMIARRSAPSDLADETLAHFQDFSLRLIAAMTPTKTKN